MRFWFSFLAFALWAGSAIAQQDMKVMPLTLEGETTKATFNAEIAETPEQKERGLMFRQVMPDDAAMIFLFSPPQPAHFWMKNTLVPLDMIFVHKEGDIAALAEDTVPNSLDVIGVQDDIAAVVEVKAGTAKRIGLKKGSRVSGLAFPFAN